MENRLELNKKPVYELPDEVVIGEYIRSKDIKRYRKPNFEPDLCIIALGRGIGAKKKNKRYCCEIWIKTENKELIEFIKNYNFKNKVKTSSVYALGTWRFKKIILEEFYNVKGGNDNNEK